VQRASWARKGFASNMFLDLDWVVGNVVEENFTLEDDVELLIVGVDRRKGDGVCCGGCLK
tara:strand:+ start:286 stop:465 length:180 start_codon:yes stop_codon:yes gene_type:complete